jgi:hypothetical protein
MRDGRLKSRVLKWLAAGGVVFGCAVAACAQSAILAGSRGELSLQQQVQVLNEGLQAFDRGAALRQQNPTEASKAFRDAAARFQLLADTGLKNGKLFYNLGNAYLECGQIGKAILNYRRAEELIPDDGRLVANLRYARSLRRNQLTDSGERAFVQTLFFWHYGSSVRGRFIAATVAYLVFWGSLIAALFVRRVRWRYAVVPFLVGWVVLGVSVGVSLVERSTQLNGVVVADNITVRKGNGEGFEPQFKEALHEGVEFNVVERRTDWLHIQLPDGKTGWIRARDAELI